MAAFFQRNIPQPNPQPQPVVEEEIPMVQEEVASSAAELEVQAVPAGTVDFKTTCNQLLKDCGGDKDLLNFAWFLHKNGYAPKNDSPNHPAEWEILRMTVNFCNTAKCRSSSEEMNTSRLEQMYLTDSFSDVYDTLWAKKENIHAEILNRCNYCRFCGDESHVICPYFLCYCIDNAAKQMGVETQSLYERLLGDAMIPFRGRVANKLNVNIDPEDYKGIDSKSAHSAYFLIESHLIRVKNMSGGIVEYTHLPICRFDDRKSQIGSMINFWKTGAGQFGTIAMHDKVGILQVKSEGCRKCRYTQCPHKLAAYIIGLASKYGVDAQDLAWYITVKTTYANISVGDNFQFNKYLRIINESPMKEESKAHLLKMIHYIVGRQKNNQIPFLPFNLVITSPDKTNAEKIANVFYNALWHFDYYRQGKDSTNWRSVYLSTVSASALLDLYRNEPAGTTFVLYDTHLMCDNDVNSPGFAFKNSYHELMKIMQDRKNTIQSVIIGTRDEVNNFFQAYPELRQKIFTKHLEMFDLDKDTVFDKIYDKLSTTFEIPEDVADRLAQYINVIYPASAKRSMEFVDELYENLLFNHYNHDVQADNVLKAEDIPYVRPPRSEQAIFEEIEKLVGLANVKKELREVNDLVKFKIKMGANSRNSVNLHMVFNGNPGTGKTTVARLTAEILHSIGFIQENKLVICSAKDLIGEYTGQTTPKTAKCCEAAYNGVLFIDEAYQLNPYTSNQTDTFKEECIAELIQQMENNRDRLVVIFAGYTDEMEDFLNKANTGLRSRIGKRIEFPDYNVDELVEIFRRIVTGSGMTLGEGAEAKVAGIIAGAMLDAKRFGNARFARNLFEHSLMRHASITANLDAKDPQLKILEASEITHMGNT